MTIIRSAIIVSVVTSVAVVAVGALTLLLGDEEIDPRSGIAILRAYRMLVASAVAVSFIGLVAWLVPRHCPHSVGVSVRPQAELRRSLS